MSGPWRTSRQVVLPPYRTVPGPGQGIEPRTPQNLMCVAVLISAHYRRRTGNTKMKIGAGTTGMDAIKNVQLAR